MRLINDIKLDFKDVLFVPKRSTLFSRSEVSLERTYTFPNSKYTWTGVPIVVANMDTTGTFEMAQQMAKHKCITCIHKHYSLDQWKNFITNNHNIMDYFAVSIGVRDHDIEKLNQIMDFDKSLHGDTGIKFICIDVANGYSELFLEKVKYVRSLYPTKTIIAGNVVTNEMTEELIMNGVDIIKAGIGGGCLAEGTKILMANGTYKNIEAIENGDYVINMNGEPVKVINKFDMGVKDVLSIESNNKTLHMTNNHKIYITNKTNKKWEKCEDIDYYFNCSLYPKNINWMIEKENIIISDEIEYNLTYDLGYCISCYDYEDKCFRYTRDNLDITKILSVFNLTKQDIKIMYGRGGCRSVFIKNAKINLLLNQHFNEKNIIKFNINYLNGLYDGLTFYNKTVFNKNVFTKISMLLSKNIYNRLTIKNKYEKRQVYDIMVDCPTHSFIAENMIVHNSVCTTRIKTGVGYPQLSMVMECADAAHGLKGMVMSDGGCTNSGDIAKAFGAGADFVMLGGMMSGHDESDGDIVEENGIKYKEFYGMSSSTAMNKHNGGVAKYRASEGKRVLVKYKGPVENTINDIMGGIRSTCTYVGAQSLKELSKRTTFIRVTQQSNEVYGKN